MARKHDEIDPRRGEQRGSGRRAGRRRGGGGAGRVALLALGLLAGASGRAVAQPCAPRFVDVVATDTGSYALGEDGSVWVFGLNLYGRLGLGPGTTVADPQPIPGLEGAVALSAHVRHALAALEDGSAWSWGRNERGQLGDGTDEGDDPTITWRYSPTRVVGLTGVVGVAAGGQHSLALRGDGTVWAWGANDEGQLGTGDAPAGRLVPVQVPGLDDAVAVAAGWKTSYALLSSGTVWAWGLNDFGQVGDGSRIDRESPVRVGLLSGFRDVAGIAVASSEALAVKTDGTVFHWGVDTWDGSYRLLPVQKAGLSGMVAVAGPLTPRAIRSDGTAWAWGSRAGDGALGDGLFNGGRTTPEPVVGLGDVVAVSGAAHGLAADASGAVWAWGRNHAWQLGDGTQVPRALAEVVDFPDTALPVTIDCPDDVQLTCGAEMPTTFPPPTVDGGCGEVDVSDSDVEVPGCGATTTIERTYTATDGRTSDSCTQLIEIVDTLAPELSSEPADATVPCDAVPAMAAVTAFDYCDPAPDLVTSEQRTDGPCPGSYTLRRRWTATDECGNETRHEQVLTVVDDEPPAVTPGSDDLHCLWPPNRRVECFDRSDFAPAIADACSDPVAWRLVDCLSDQPDTDAAEPDCTVAADGSSICVRAERDGTVAAGRRYAVTIAAEDDCGNVSADTVIGFVHVPHDSQSWRAACR